MIVKCIQKITDLIEFAKQKQQIPTQKWKQIPAQKCTNHISDTTYTFSIS